MSGPSTVTRQHLDRLAMIYVRQSTLTQVIVNQESLRLQYALEQRAQSLGWRAEAIEVIDADLGAVGADSFGTCRLQRTGEPGVSRRGRRNLWTRSFTTRAQLRGPPAPARILQYQ